MTFCVDNKLLVDGNINLFHKTEELLSKIFAMKDLKNILFVLSVETHFNKTHGQILLAPRIQINLNEEQYK